MDDERASAEFEGSVVLDNERVRVQRFVLEPGRSTSRHGPLEGQLLIYIRGGETADGDGRVTSWDDGRVRWFDQSSSDSPTMINVGETDIEMVVITLHPLLPGAVPPAEPVGPLRYPNVDGEDLLENDLVVVQRFVIAAGQWEGVHAHQPNMMFVHIHGGHWAARTYVDPPSPYPEPSVDGEVGWMEPVDISVGHQSGNVGSTPIDFLWVSLKQ